MKNLTLHASFQINVSYSDDADPDEVQAAVRQLLDYHAAALEDSGCAPSERSGGLGWNVNSAQFHIQHTQCEAKKGSQND